MLLMAVAGVAQGTAISVAMDMTEGIARFRTMAIFGDLPALHPDRPRRQRHHPDRRQPGYRPRGRLLIGFRPAASPVEWTMAVGLLALITFAITWLSVACGLVSYLWARAAFSRDPGAHGSLTVPIA
jgi:ABC-2 type transport system permease protein